MRRPSLHWLSFARQLPLADGDWAYSRAPRAGDPAQGWKLHLSATIFSASDVLKRARPVLVRHEALFKIPARWDALVSLNTGLVDYSQIGKFLTVYPRSPDEARVLADELHRVTRGLPGPRVPFDLPYRPRSVVHYRYGSFRNAERVIYDAQARPHPDVRAPGNAVPAWLKDPFQRNGYRKPRTRGPLGVEYLPFAAVMQRGKGGVYEALDLTVSPARYVMIKEGRRHGEVSLDGSDGFSRSKHEARVLHALQKAGAAVPELFGQFAQDGNHYLVLEKIPSRPLLPSSQVQPATPSWRRAKKILDLLEPELARIHAAGWVWRDCKPSHIFVHRGRVWLIDFEGACRVNDTNVLPWGSANYVSGQLCRRPRARLAGTGEDTYALGVIAFQVVTSSFPPADSSRRAELYAHAKCPRPLSDRIERRLRGL